MVSQFRPNPDAVAQRVGDDIVLVHLKTDRIFALNGTGARIWELLLAKCDRKEMEQRLHKEFDVEKAQLERQIDDLLAALKKESFISGSNF